MAGEGPQIAEAFISIKARKAADFDADARRMGKEAGKEYQTAYERETGRGVAGGRARRMAEGRQAGADIGDAAGKEAGARTSKGISTGLAQSRASARRDGDALGRVLGSAAGARAGTSTAAGIKDQLKASYGSFQKDGAALGDVLGAAAGAHAATLTRKAIRRELAAEERARAAENRAEAKASATAERALEKAAAAAARLAARTAREETRASAVRAREIAKEAALAERLGAQAELRFKARIGRVQKIASGGLKGLFAFGGLGALASSASGLGTVIAGTVGAVASLSGALALLPAVAVGAAAGMAALKIGLHDVGTALSDSGDPEKYAEDLKKLAPAARGFVRAVVKLKPELKALRNEVQQGLFKGLDKQVTALGARYLPILSAGLTDITKGFNAGAISVAKFLDKSKSSQQVAGILGNTALASRNLGEAFKPAVQGLLDLATVGSGFLPKLTAGIGDAATRLSKFIDAAHKSGDLRAFIQGGIDGFQELGSVMAGAGRILGGIFQAGGGANGGGLATLASILNKVADQIARPEFQAGLGNFFSSLREAGDKVGAALPKVGDALIALEPAISRLVSGSGTALASILTTAADAAITLAPTLNTLAVAFESLAPHAGELVIALIALKVALGGLSVASGVVDALGLVGGRMDKVGLGAQAAKVRTLGFSGALGVLSTAVAVVGVAALARQLGEYSGRANVATIDTGKLADSLAGLGKSGQLGAAGIALFQNKGVFGLVGNDADTSSEALERFGTAAYNALDQGWDARLGRFQSFGQTEAAFRKQTEQLDKSFRELAGRGAIDSATGSFEKFIAAGVKAGVPVATLKAQFPQFSASLKAAGLTVDNATGKVVVLSGALKGLPAAKTVRINAPGMTAATARAFALQAALKRLPTNKVIDVTTRFFKVGKEPGTPGNGLGFRLASGGQVPQRRASGGLLDPRLGGPRQDNVPVLASGGEFIMNAFATAQPGVLALLRKINATNRYPQKLASGGQVRRAGAGLNDLTASTPTRITRIEAARAPAPAAGSGTSRIHPDDIAAIIQGFAAATRQQRIVLDPGLVAGAVLAEAGRVL